MKKCPKCGKEVSDNINVCTACGTRISESKEKVETNQASSMYGIISGIFAIAGIYLIANVWAIVGAVIYFIGFGLAFSEVKRDKNFENKNYSELIKSNFNKKNILKKGIPTIVVVIVPFVIAFALYGWIVLDSVRTAEYITEMF